MLYQFLDLKISIIYIKVTVVILGKTFVHNPKLNDYLLNL